jgi:outer membrane protein assembly factor BamB
MENTVKRLLPFIILAVMSTSTFAAEPQWPRFRGLNGAGISDAATVPVKWTDKDYNWTVDLPGTGYSSPVVCGSKIFLTATDKTATRMVLCVSADDGRLLWRKDYKSTKHRMHRDNSYAAATPAVDSERVYVTWTTPEKVTLAALDHDGKEIWNRNLGPYVGLHGGGVSPIVVGGLVILANDQEDMKWYGFLSNKSKGVSFLLAVDCKTGETRWKIPRKTTLGAYGTPCVRKGDDGKDELVFISTAYSFTALDAASGKENWNVPKVFLDRCAGSPIIADGLVIASYGRGNYGSLLVAVRPGSKKNNVRAKVQWSMTKKVPLTPTSLAIGGRLFCLAGEGVLTCLDIKTGKRIWQEKVGGKFYASPVCVNGRLYCVSKKGVVFVFAAGDKYELLHKTSLGEMSYSTPAVANGVMYIRSKTKLRSLGGKK